MNITIPILLVSTLLLSTNSAFSADSLDDARTQAYKQLQDTYAKNKQQALIDAKKDKDAAAPAPPPPPPRPLWEQAVNPKDAPAVAPNVNVPAPKVPGAPADTSSQLPANPFQVSPSTPPAQQGSTPPPAASGETAPPTNIYQFPAADQNAPANVNPYR